VQQVRGLPLSEMEKADIATAGKTRSRSSAYRRRTVVVDSLSGTSRVLPNFVSRMVSWP
jgi:hypothetical protein